MYAQSQHIAQVIARTLALAGGGALIVLIVLTCLSIIGRVFVPLDIGIGPIRGIYDITEIGISAAVFAFLPLAQLRETHAWVNLFQWAIPRRINQGLDLLFNLAMAFVATVGSHRLYLGMQDKITYGETTLIAQIPVWQGHALALIGAFGFVLVAIFCVIRAARRLAGFEE